MQGGFLIAGMKHDDTLRLIKKNPAISKCSVISVAAVSGKNMVQ